MVVGGRSVVVVRVRLLSQSGLSEGLSCVLCREWLLAESGCQSAIVVGVRLLSESGCCLAESGCGQNVVVVGE